MYSHPLECHITIERRDLKLFDKIPASTTELPKGRFQMFFDTLCSLSEKLIG